MNCFTKKVEELFLKDCPAILSGLLKDTDYFDLTYGWFITCMFVPHLPFFKYKTPAVVLHLLWLTCRSALHTSKP